MRVVEFLRSTAIVSAGVKFAQALKNISAQAKRWLIFALGLVMFLGGVYDCQDDINAPIVRELGKDDDEKEQEPEERLESPKEVIGLLSEPGNRSVALTWDALESLEKEEAGYRIYMDGQLIIDNHSSDSIVINSDNTGLCCANGTVYAFRVSAFNKAGEGAKSDEVTSAPRPSELERLVPGSPTPGDRFVILSWNRVEEATEYRIYKNKGGATPIDNARPKIITDAEITSYRDGGLQNGVRYSYEVEPVMIVTYPDAEIKGPRGEFSAKPIADREGRPELSVAIADNTSLLASVTLTITAVKSDIKNSTADEYKILVRKNSDDSMVSGISDQTITPAPPDGGDAGTSITTHTVSGLEYLTEVEISVVPIRGTVEIPADVVQAFFLPRAAPLGDQTVPRLTLPGEGERPNRGVQLEWDALSHATHYQIKRKEVGVSGPAVTVVGISNGAIAGFDNAGVCCSRLDSLAADNKQYIYTLQAFRMKVIDGTLTELSRSGVSPDTSIDTTIVPSGSLEALVSGTKIDPLKYVNTLIATGTTIRVSGSAIGGNNETNNPEGAHYPFGMTTFTPLNSINTYDDGDSQWGAEDRWTHYASRKHRVKAFAVTDLNGPGCDAAGDFPMMMHPGKIKNKSIYFSSSVLPLYIKGTNVSSSDKGKRSDSSGVYPTSNVVGEAGYYKVIFENDMTAELTTSKRSGIAKFTFPASIDSATLFFTTASRMTRSSTSFTASSALSGSANTKAIQAKITNKGFCADNASAYTIYMYAEFDKNSLSTTPTSKTESHQYRQLGYEFDLTKVGRTIHVKYGISYVNAQGAYNNLASEIPDFNFDTVKENTQAAWRNLLSRVQVYTSDESSLSDKLTLFYSGLYRSLHSPGIFSDVDCKYIGFNNSIYTIPSTTKDEKTTCNRTQYQNFSGWDTYRSQSQLIALIDKKIAADMAQSLVNNSKQANCDKGKDVDQGNCSGGSFTRWGLANDDAGTMAGEPGAIIVANTLAFGATDFKLDEALAAMSRGQSGNRSDNSQIGSTSYNPYKNHEQKRIRSSELELASAYFAKAAFAKRLAKIKSDSDFAQRYQILASGLSGMESGYNTKATGFFTDNQNKLRISTGETVGGVSATNSWQEGNEHQYKWMYPPNVAKGSLSIVGKYFSGKTLAQITSSLNSHVSVLNSGEGNNDTGLFFGNEPGHFTPFVYNFLPGGKTTNNTQAPNSYESQDIITRIQKNMYKNQIDEALPGNEDLGAMAAWYVWTAMGLYPSIPGLGFYNLTSPLFDYILIEKGSEIDNGYILIKALNSKDRRYISGIKLNKQAHSKTYVTFHEMYQKLVGTTEITQDEETKKVTILEFTLVQEEDDSIRTLEVSPSFSTLAEIDDYL